MEPQPKVYSEKINILLIDDEEDLRELVQKILEQAGFSCDSFSDCRLALERLKTNSKSYDVIISDLYVPGMTGSSFLKQLNQDISNHPPVIFLTGCLDTNEVILKNPELKGTPVIEKPFEKHDLLNTIKEVVAIYRSKNLDEFQLKVA